MGCRSKEALSRENVLTFLREKGISPECPSCHQNNWYLGADEQKFSAMLMEPKLDDPADLSPPLVHLPLVYLVCHNCGHARIYSKAVVKRFTEARAAQSEIAGADSDR